MFRGPTYSRPFPYRRENEQSPRRSPRRRIAPHGERRPDTAPEEIALAPARAGKNLKVEQRIRLRDLLRYNLKTVRAYLLKEAFQQLWDYNSSAWAGKFLDEWRRQAMRARIEPMKKIARSLRQHRELILNCFRAQKLISSGVVEGLYNKAKELCRKHVVSDETFRKAKTLLGEKNVVDLTSLVGTYISIGALLNAGEVKTAVKDGPNYLPALRP